MCHIVTTQRAIRALPHRVTRKKRALPTRIAASVFMSAVMSLLGATPAAADSATGDQNPNYMVSVALASNGADPNQAAPGDTVTATMSVTNETTSFRNTVASIAVGMPSGNSLAGNFNLPLAPNQTVTQTFNFTIPKSLPPGQYNWTLSAGDATSKVASVKLTSAMMNKPEPVAPDPKDPKPNQPGTPVPVPPTLNVSSATASLTVI